MLEANYDDRTIAMILARQGGLPPLGYTFTKTRAARLRVENKIPVPSAESVIPADDDALMVGIAHAEPILGVSKVTININRWLREGFIAGTQVIPVVPGESGSMTKCAPESLVRRRKLGLESIRQQNCSG
ncbi:MAG TPA: hypothetical protein VHI31_04275 [Actinomycetota bacterium]|nr:hypothetical protein [Actinomycetota bacterium]